MSYAGKPPTYYPPGDPPIVFFDGVCGLCNRSVDFLMRHDRTGQLHFSTLQGTTAGRMLPVFYTEDLDSVVLYQEGELYHRSDAILRAMKYLGGGCRIFAMCMLLIPSPLRDLGYRLIARYRYPWFGMRDVCRIPTEEERRRFLP